MTKAPQTDQFRQLHTSSGKQAFEAYLAVYANCGDHVVIAAPTLEKLAVAYERLTQQQLIVERAQKVYITRATK